MFIIFLNKKKRYKKKYYIPLFLGFNHPIFNPTYVLIQFKDCEPKIKKNSNLCKKIKLIKP